MAMAMAAPLFTPCSHVASSRRNLVGSASNLLSSPFSAAGANSLVAPFPGKLSPAPRKYFRVEATEKSRKEIVKLRHIRIRKKLEGTTERPRLAVFRSNKHLYAQVIDDTNMHTLAAVSTIQKDIREELQLTSGPTIEAAKRIGAEIAKVCLEKGITKVAFDRGGFVYHGRIQALAESARENGLDF